MTATALISLGLSLSAASHKLWCVVIHCTVLGLFQDTHDSW